MNTIKYGKWLLSLAVPALLLGCQEGQRAAGSKLGVQEIPRLTSAYLAVPAHGRIPTLQPGYPPAVLKRGISKSWSVSATNSCRMLRRGTATLG